MDKKVTMSNEGPRGSFKGLFRDHTSELLAWRVRVLKEKNCRNNWTNKWGLLHGCPLDFLSEEEKKRKEEIRLVRERFREQLLPDLCKTASSTNEKWNIQSALPSPPFPMLTSQEVGHRSAPEYNINKYFTTRHAQRDIYKVFGWPDGFIG